MKRVMLMWLLMLSVSFVACSEGGPEEEPTPKPEIDYTEDITAHIDANFAKELQRHKLIANALRITRADVRKIEKIDFVYGDAHSFFPWIAEASCGNQRKCYTFTAVRLCHLQALFIAGA